MSPASSPPSPPSAPAATSAARGARFAATARAIERHPARAALACFVLVALALTGRALLGAAALGPDAVLDRDPLYAGATLPPPVRSGDTSSLVYEYVHDRAFAAGLHHGRLDAWNPLEGCGAPLWADQGAPFFPLKWIYDLVPSPRTYDLFLALRLVLIALGAYLLARRRGLGPLGAIAAGVLLEASGWAVAWTAFGSTSPAYLLPWVLLGAQLLGDGGGPRAAVLAGLALAMAGLGGHPSFLVLDALAFALAILAEAFAARRRGVPAARVVGWGALAALLGMGLAAPALLPALEVFKLARSYKDLPAWQQIYRGYLHADQRVLPLGLLAPHVLLRLRHVLWPLFPRVLGPVIGVLGLALAIAGCLGDGLGLALWVVGIAGVGLAVAPPGLSWLHALPLAGYVAPAYAWGLPLVALAQAAGHGVEQLATPAGRRRAFTALALLVLGLSTLLCVRYDPRSGVPYGRLLERALGGVAGKAALVVPFLVAALALGMAAALARTRLRALAGPLIVVIALGDLLVATAPQGTRRASAVLAGAATGAASPAVRWLQRALAPADARLIGLPLAVGLPNTPSLFGLADFRESTPVPLRRFAEYVAAIEEPPPGRYPTQQTVDVAVSPLLDLAAVRWVVVGRAPGVTAPAILAGDPHETLAFDGRRVAIYQNRAALPRAWIAHETVALAGEEAARAVVARVGADHAHAADLGLDARVFLEIGEDGPPPPELHGGAPGAGEAAVVVPDGDPDRVVVDARLDRPGMVVVADAYFPGWRATVDGTSAPVFPADLLFRAVPVPAGRHRVVLEYHPLGLRTGLLFALATLLACLLLFFPRLREWHHPRAASGGDQAQTAQGES